jgi:hypothetical protein
MSSVTTETLQIYAFRAIAGMHLDLNNVRSKQRLEMRDQAFHPASEFLTTPLFFL